jgi:hypothetical protein
MIKPSAQLLRALSATLFCLTLTGVPGAIASDGPVIGWSQNDYGQATPPDAVNGVSGTATDISAGGEHTLAIAAPLKLPRPAPLTKAQQTCVNQMNKSGEMVNKAQLKENERCLKDFQKENLVARMTLDVCMAADRRGKMQRARARTAMRESRSCASLDVPPPFAYTDPATVNAAAGYGARALIYKIFGGPLTRDAHLATLADSKDTARCQLEMLRRANKLENTIVKEVNKAVKQALKLEGVVGETTLEAKLWPVFSSNDRVSRVRDMLVNGVDRRCAALPTAPDAIFAGKCGEGNPSLGEIEACAIAAARCEACMKINAFDDLNLNCDQADDQVVNGSCGERDFGGHGLTNADCFDFDTCASEATSTWARACCGLAEANPDMPFTPADYQGMPDDCKPLVNPICR